MSSGIFALVMMAAVMHAVWNAIVKASPDRASVLGLISFGHVIFGCILALFVPLPPLESWPYIAASTVIHILYYYLLFHSYRVGDLSQVYPIARGLSPLLVTLGAQFIIGETLPFVAWLGVLAISAGIFLLSAQSAFSAASKTAIWLAVATGFTIGAYSIVDGLGGRVGTSVLAYVAWLFICEVVVVLFVFARRQAKIFSLPKSTLISALAGGVISALAYGLVIYAKSLAPLGAVSALRETSVIFAALIGIYIFGEKPRTVRLMSACVVTVGIILIAQS